MNGSLKSARGPEKPNPRKVDSAREIRRRLCCSGLRRRVSRERSMIVELNQTSPLVSGEISPPMDPLDDVNGAEREGC